MIKFLANENVPSSTVRRLRNEGFDVVSVGENFPSIKDEAIILSASAEDRIIITFDRDYGELIFKTRHSAAVRNNLFSNPKISTRSTGADVNRFIVKLSI